MIFLLEIRKDYLFDRYVITAERRELRPRQFIHKIKAEEPKVCFFCLGNEKFTPREIGRVEKKGKWQIRWFPNKFPFLDKKSKVYGCHEVIVETPEHKKQLWDLSEDEINVLLGVYVLRIKELSKDKKIKYVSVFKNHGRDGGTSIIHSHTQIGAISYVPPLVLDKVKLSHKNKKCLYCTVIKRETKSKRKIFENKTFIAFCPYASRFNFEAWIFPKKHIKSIVDFNEEQLFDLAIVLRKILVKLKKLGASYNFYLIYAPSGKDLHFHIEVIPRLAKFAGFEFATGTFINSISPERAAKFYRS